MSFNGSGTYSLPTGNPVVVNTTVDATVHNNTNADIATALSNCVTRDGQSLPTADLPMGGHKLTGLAAGTGNGESVRYEQLTQKEDTANKSTTLVADQASSVKFPTVKSVYDWVTGFFVSKTSSTGSALLPSGTTAQRDVTPTYGAQRSNTDLNRMEWWNGSNWTAMGGGATGGSTDAVFNQTDQLVTQSWTVGQDGMVSGVTVTIATPAVFTLNNHGFVAGQPIRFTTTGALPTGLSTTVQYYVIGAGYGTNTFQVSTTSGGAAVNTSGTQSGVHSVGKSKDALITKALTVLSGQSVTVPTGSSLVVVGAGNPTLADLYVNTSTAQIVNGQKNFSSAPLWNGSDITGIGVGQTWQSTITGAITRASGVTYTNTTGKPITVMATSGTAGGHTITVGGVTVNNTASAAATDYTFHVPNGATYSITMTQALAVWSELR